MTQRDYLLNASEPWVKMRTLLDIDDLQQSSPKVLLAKQETLQDPMIGALIDELKDWPGTVLNSHKSAGQHYHKLSFLADIGLTKNDEGISFILDQVMKHKSEEGLYTLPTNIPVHFGGSGETEWAWALCDAPILLYCLAKMGYADHPDVLKGKRYLLSLIEDQGWPCKVSKNLGKFRGPGKKDDPCPYVNLIMLKLLSVYKNDLDIPETRKACETLLHLWDASLEKHPYMFYMGTDFRKLKVPFIWYDLLHVTDVLSNFPFVYHDPRFLEMVNLILSKADENQRYTPESEWMAWKPNNFATKKQVSSWLTFIVERINHRVFKKSD